MKNNQYIEFYSQVKDTIAQRSCTLMNAHREEALRVFSEQGFPSKKVERYRYTDVAQDFAPDYGIQLSASAAERTEFCCSVREADIDLTPYYNNIADDLAGDYRRLGLELQQERKNKKHKGIFHRYIKFGKEK